MVNKILILAILAFCGGSPVSAQTGSPAVDQPTDYLTKDFHAGRRQALRDMMSPNSVAIIFAYPEQVFSNDVNYVYHPNPDLYYFSGYREPNAMLLVFKDMQGSGDSSYNELFFVQHRDPLAEQWTGRRLGVEGVKASLGFKRVYNGEEFGNFPLDLKRFDLLYDKMPDTSGSTRPGNLEYLVRQVTEKGGVQAANNEATEMLARIYQYGNPRNLPRLTAAIKGMMESGAFINDSLIQPLMARPDSTSLADFKKKYSAVRSGNIGYNLIINALRGIKTPEELALLKKSIVISSLAHAEAMRAVKPQMSERELEGIMFYVHKKYGAENEGYPPIIGAGGNGCILHYEENNSTHVNNQLVLMDVGAEYHGYSADVTRTFPANGKFTVEQKAIYQLVYDAQEKVFPLCRKGIPFDSLQKKTVEVLADGLMKLGLIKERKDVYEYYPHGVSHQLGLDVHDKGSPGPLQENMVITVEPGIYIPEGSPCDKKWWNIGVRIEDDVVVGATGCTNLSADAPRKWQDIEKTIAAKSLFDGAGAVFPPLK